MGSDAKNPIIEGRAMICILIRDCEGTLKALFREVERLRKCFDDSRVLIVENNSRDRSRKMVLKYQNRCEGVFADCFDDPEYDLMPRIAKFVRLRNRVLDAVKNSTFRPDYLILVDGDIEFDYEGILKAIRSAPADWAGLFADGRFFIWTRFMDIPVLYYDLFAYLPAGCSNEMLTEKEMLAGREALHRSLRFHRYAACDSAFGGVGVYKYSAADKCCYLLEENDRSSEFDYVCEHIPFNRKIREYGSLYICRDMKVRYERISFVKYLSVLAEQHNREKEFQFFIKLYNKITKKS